MGVTGQVTDIRWNLSLKGERQVQKGLNDTGDAAKEAGDQLEGMGDQAETAGKKTDKAGGKFKDAAKDTGFLDRQIKEATGSLRDLITQLDRTGDTSLLKDIRKQGRELRQFTNIAKQIAEPAGRSMVESLAEAFKTGSAALKGAAVPVMVGAAAAAAPFIGAAISAAVVSGVGAGGLAAGIALAVQDPATKEAAAGLGESLREAFAGSADQFTAPLLGAFEILGDAGRQFAAKLRLNELAPLVTTLAKGFAGLAESALPGLNKALVASKPLLRVIASELPGLGDSISHFFSVLADQSDSAAIGLTALIRGLGSVIEFSGEALAKLGLIFEWMVTASAKVTGIFEDLYGWIPFLGDHFASTNDEMEDLLGSFERGTDGSKDFAGGITVIGESAEESAAKVQQLKDGIESLFNKTMDLDQATLQYKRGFATLNEELTNGKRTLDQNTEAGQENVEAILRRIQELETLRAKQAESNMGVDKANRLYETHLDQLRKNLLQLGYNKKAVDEIIERYKAIPRTVETQVKLTATGDPMAWAMFRAQERKDEERSSSNAPGRASGGPVQRGVAYWVGERGPELVTFGDNGYVHNATASQAMATSGRSGGSSMPMGGGFYLAPAPNMPADMTQFATLLIPYFQVVIAGLGGDVQEAMGTPTR